MAAAPWRLRGGNITGRDMSHRQRRTSMSRQTKRALRGQKSNLTTRATTTLPGSGSNGSVTRPTTRERYSTLRGHVILIHTSRRHTRRNNTTNNGTRLTTTTNTRLTKRRTRRRPNRNRNHSTTNRMSSKARNQGIRPYKRVVARPQRGRIIYNPTNEYKRHSSRRRQRTRVPSLHTIIKRRLRRTNSTRHTNRSSVLHGSNRRRVTSGLRGAIWGQLRLDTCNRRANNTPPRICGQYAN